MPRSTDLTKSWIPGSARTTQTFNAPSNMTIPYGQYKGTISGRAGTGNDPVASAYSITYSTNYNVAYPIGTQPIATQPATAYTITYNTNYNVAYPIATQPATAYTILYNTNYNVAYPIATQPETGRPATAYTITYATNYNVAYPVATQPETGRPATAWTTNYNVSYPIGNQPVTGSNPPTGFNWNAAYTVFTRITDPVNGSSFYSGPDTSYASGSNPTCPSPYNETFLSYEYDVYIQTTYSCTGYGGTTTYATNYNVSYAIANQPATAYTITYSTNYNVAYPVGTQPATAYTITYATNYNVAYPVANQPETGRPVTAYTITYATNYNIAYPVATRPEASRPATAWTTNYNVAYPIATQPESGRPATAWTTNYSTNYNIAYPIATQPETGRPVTAYTPGNPGGSTTVLGVYFPGGGISTVAPYVPATEFKVHQFPEGSYPVGVPPGGQIVIKLE